MDNVFSSFGMFIPQQVPQVAAFPLFSAALGTFTLNLSPLTKPFVSFWQ